MKIFSENAECHVLYMLYIHTTKNWEGGWIINHGLLDFSLRDHVTRRLASREEDFPFYVRFGMCTVEYRLIIPRGFQRCSCSSPWIIEKNMCNFRKFPPRKSFLMVFVNLTIKDIDFTIFRKFSRVKCWINFSTRICHFEPSPISRPYKKFSCWEFSKFL